MKNLKNIIFIMSIIASILLSFCAIPTTTLPVESFPKDIPVTQFKGNVILSDWLIAGPFSTSSSDTLLADGTYDIGYSRDYLLPVGGEQKVVLRDGMSIDSMLVQRGSSGGQGIVDLATMYANLEHHVAYGYSQVYSQSDAKIKCLLGSDDAVKVWVNGVLVHSNYIFRGTTPGDDRFDIDLKKGFNSILVKVLNGTAGWGFSVELLDWESWTALEKLETEKREFEAFLNSEIVPDWYNAWDETFNPGPFPKMRWEQPLLAQKVIGSAPLNIRWFDSDLNEVEKAAGPGRYGFIAECVSKKGKTIRRAGTLYCYPWDWMGWSERPIAELAPIPAARFDASKLEKHKHSIANYVGRMMLLSTLNQKEGAALMSFLYEVNQGKYAEPTLASPLLADDEFHIKLQKKVGGIKYSGKGLQLPEDISDHPAQTLKPGTPEQAGFKPEIIADLKKVCTEWFEASGEPFITLVARNGVIVYEEATGGDANGAFTTSTATPVASTTKLITGITFAQYMYQGLIQIDDMVGAYFPDFPLEGEKALTLRHCFTHTSGLVGHERWGGVHNHRLENIVANQLEYLPVGKKSTYNGDGYNLAGRVMEAVAGKSIFRVIHENLIIPLQLENSEIEEDLAFSFQSTAGDLAIIGQMLLNRGSYGDYKFFSPQVFEQLLPRNLSQYYPGMDWDQGIGMTWLRTRHPEAGKNGNPSDMTVLSKNVIGHGSATSTVLRVDLDNGLVITQSRRQGGAHYDYYLTKLMQVIEKNLNE